MALNTSNTTRADIWRDGGLGEKALTCYMLLQQNRTDLDLRACHAATAASEGNRASSAASYVFGIAIILVNAPVILGIVRKRSLHRPMYYLIANMAGVDAMVGVMCFVLPTVRQSGGGDGTYLKLYTTFFFSIFLSLTGLMLLTLDRYMSIYHTLFHQTRLTGKHVAWAVLLTWVLSALACYSPLLGWTCRVTKVHPDMCIDFVDLNYFVFLVVVLLVAVSIVVIVNTRIYVTLRRRLLAVGVGGNAHMHMNAQHVTAAKRKAGTVAILAGACILSWTPYIVAIIQLLDAFYMRSVEERLASTPGGWGVAIVFLGVFPLLNPILYAFRLPQLRKAVKKLFQDICPRCCRSANQVAPLGNPGGNNVNTDALTTVAVH